MKLRSSIVVLAIFGVVSGAGLFQSRQPMQVKESLTVVKIDINGARQIVAKLDRVTKRGETGFDRKLAYARILVGAQDPWYSRLLNAVAPSAAQAIIPDSGETAIRDLLVASTYKYHGLGSGSTAAAESDTGCQTEFSTQYNPDNTRATGSQTNNGADVYRSVGTNTVDASATARNFCLMSQAATGGGTMLAKIVFAGDISLSSGDAVQTTYDLTIA